jgi:hypothetical protein
MFAKLKLTVGELVHVVPAKNTYRALIGAGLKQLMQKASVFAPSPSRERAGVRVNNLKYSSITAVLLTMVLTTMVLTTTAHSEEQIEMELTVVKGNKELPKVLYIVPWKRLADGNIKQKLVLHSLFEDAFDPIEPHAFERYVEDYRYFANTETK